MCLGSLDLLVYALNLLKTYLITFTQMYEQYGYNIPNLIIDKVDK